MQDREVLQEILDEVRKLNHLITGNGTPERGLLIRVDRLEQQDKNRVWWLRTAVTAAFGAIGFQMFGPK
jgi:hypothetical protein